MTTLESTGAMVFGSPSKSSARHLWSVSCGDDAANWARTPMDVGCTAPALREAVVMFSGALDDFCPTAHIWVVKRSNGQLRVLGPTPRLEGPISYIGVPVDTGHTDEMSDIVQAFESIRTELGLTQKQMFSATGIKKRTYHSWNRKPPGTRPRVSSQGRFWRLVDAVEDLRDTVDRPLDQWVRGDRRRLGALIDGRFDELVDLAVNRPSYPKRSLGTSVYSGITEDIDVPVIRTGKTNIEDVEDGL
jgi:hypothetical protein